MSESLTSQMLQIDRTVRSILRQANDETVLLQKQDVADIKQVLYETRLDVRDYESAQTRSEQEKHAMSGQRNLNALNELIAHHGSLFGPVDVAELGARIDSISSSLE